MDGPEINKRALRFGCRRGVEVYRILRKAGGASWEIAPQFLKASTSIGANLEEATAGQTKADFVAKVCIALKEAREARFWLRLIIASDLLPPGVVQADLHESDELIAILVTIIRNARSESDRG